MSRRSEERDVIVLEREGGTSLWWFLVGGALGAGLALLFAPQSGDKTRRQLGRRLVALRDSAGEAIEELKETFDPGAPAEGPEGEEEEDEEPAPAPRQGVSAARRELERRLADARTRRRQALADEDEEPVA